MNSWAFSFSILLFLHSLSIYRKREKGRFLSRPPRLGAEPFMSYQSCQRMSGPDWLLGAGMSISSLSARTAPIPSGKKERVYAANTWLLRGHGASYEVRWVGSQRRSSH
ncbi:hypothetical protein Pyn_14732 [Prunus yedoensis var. nudiflora]|uniref:Secreted protein n=1 Tax=Prunus yedoensis var. nudiflora TaxID=2094558 RepID=A0A314UKT1_PRUYE|nr:hypothetical protein Pyn_14732 [Prunus yedoensis var. nudiflora]